MAFKSGLFRGFTRPELEPVDFTIEIVEGQEDLQAFNVDLTKEVMNTLNQVKALLLIMTADIEQDTQTQAVIDNVMGQSARRLHNIAEALQRALGPIELTMSAPKDEIKWFSERKVIRVKVKGCQWAFDFPTLGKA